METKNLSSATHKCVLVIDNAQPTGIVANIASVLSMTLGCKVNNITCPLPWVCRRRPCRPRAILLLHSDFLPLSFVLCNLHQLQCGAKVDASSCNTMDSCRGGIEWHPSGCKWHRRNKIDFHRVFISPVINFILILPKVVSRGMILKHELWIKFITISSVLPASY